MKISCGLKLLVLGLTGLLLAATFSSGLSRLEVPSVSQAHLKNEWIQGLRFSAEERRQALHARERNYYGLRAFERLSPDMRERLLMREQAGDPRWRASEAAQQVDPSKISPVVQIAAFQDKMALGPGSGTLIHPSGLILTNSHVVRKGPGGCGVPVQGDLGSLFVVLVTEEGKEDQPPVPKFTAVLVAEDPQLDVALLEIKQQVDGLKDLKELKEAIAQGRLSTSPLPLGLTLPHWNLWDSHVLKEESRVLAWGYPEDKPQEGLSRLELSRGPIFTLKPPEGPQHLFIDKLFTIPGISGGPVVDPKTDLIVGVICGRGIPTKPTKPAEELTKAILIDEIQDLLKGAPQRINYYPVADFTWLPLNPKVGDVVTFDASLSFDFDGSIAQYEWDFNGGGKPDATGKQASFKLPSPEDLRVMLTVKDNEGAPNSQTKRVILQREQTCKARIGEREFASIQEAIEKAKPGDTITISEGQCQEDLLIAGKQDLTLKGAGRDKTTLFGFGRAPVIAVQDSQGITIEGLTIRDGLVGLLVQNSSDVTIRQNAVMQNLGRGISLMNASGVKIEQNVIEANGEEGLQVRGALRGEPVEVRTNEIRASEEGGVLIRETVGTQYTLRVVLADNKIEGNKLVGVAITHFAAAEISEGRITDTKEVKYQFGIGLEIDSSQFETVSITAVTVSSNQGAGIEVKGWSRRVTITSVTITSNRWGTLVMDSAQTILIDSVISNSEVNGISVAGSAVVNLTHTQISNNNEFGLLVRSLATVNLTNNSTLHDNRVGLWVFDSATANLTESQVFSNAYGLLVWDSAKVSLQNSRVFSNGGDGLQICSPDLPDQACLARVGLVNSQVFGNGGNGLSVKGLTQVSLVNSQVSSNGIDGLWVRGSAMLTITANSAIFGNGIDGLSMFGSATASLSNITLSSNRFDGLSLEGDLTIAEVNNAWISDNASCGIFRQDGAKVIGRDNWIRQNAEDLCEFSPPEGFLQPDPPRPFLDFAEVCPQGCPFTEVGPAVWAVRPDGVVHIRSGYLPRRGDTCQGP